MNETVILVLAAGLGGWGGARAIFLRRPLVDGAQGPFVPAAGAVDFWQPAAADEHALAGFYWSPAVIGSGCWPVSSDLSSRAFLVTRLTGPGEPIRPSRRRPAMRLSPDEIIFWQYGFSSSTRPSSSPGD
jgi:hypothetical protein